MRSFVYTENNTRCVECVQCFQCIVEKMLKNRQNQNVLYEAFKILSFFTTIIDIIPGIIVSCILYIITGYVLYVIPGIRFRREYIAGAGWKGGGIVIIMLIRRAGKM